MFANTKEREEKEKQLKVYLSVSPKMRYHYQGGHRSVDNLVTPNF